MSPMPWRFNSFSAYSITGRFISRIIGLGQSHVSGLSRVPSPPAMMIPFMRSQPF